MLKEAKNHVMEISDLVPALQSAGVPMEGDVAKLKISIVNGKAAINWRERVAVPEAPAEETNKTGQADQAGQSE